jgi:hypothetical protein
MNWTRSLQTISPGVQTRAIAMRDQQMIRIGARSKAGVAMGWTVTRDGFGPGLNESDFHATATSVVAQEIKEATGDRPGVVLVCLHGGKK